MKVWGIVNKDATKLFDPAEHTWVGYNAPGAPVFANRERALRELDRLLREGVIEWGEVQELD